MARFRRLTALTLMLGVYDTATAQSSAEPTPIHVQADRLYYDGRPAESLTTLRTHLARESDDGAGWWRAARAALAIGWLEPDEPVSIQRYKEAEEHALRAIQVDPTATEGHYVLAASLGRRALIAKTPRAAVALSDQIHREAMILLQLDPDHAGAHSILGQLHAEVMRKPWAIRVVGLRLGGGVEFEPSWEAADRALRKAVALEPAMMLHRFELARVQAGMKRNADARWMLETVLAMPVVHPMDRLFHHQARAMLDGLRR